MKLFFIFACMLLLDSSVKAQDINGEWVQTGNEAIEFYLYINNTSDSTYAGQTISIMRYKNKVDTLYYKLEGFYNKNDGYIYLKETELIRPKGRFKGCIGYMKLKYSNNKKNTWLKGHSIVEKADCFGMGNTSDIVLKKLKK